MFRLYNCVNRNYIFHVISMYRRKLYWTKFGYWEPTWLSMRRRQQRSCLPQKLEICLKGSQGCSHIHLICATWNTKVEDLKTVRKQNLLHTCGEWNFLNFKYFKFVQLNLFSFRIYTLLNPGLVNTKFCVENGISLKREKFLIGS
jgi:hypothetical protein